MSFWPEKVEEEGRSKDEGDRDAGEDVEGSGAYDIVVVHVDVLTWAQLLDEGLLLYVISNGGGANRFRTHTTHHGKLIDDHLGPSKVVDAIEHVGGLEFGPLHFMEVEAPDDCHS